MSRKKCINLSKVFDVAAYDADRGRAMELLADSLDYVDELILYKRDGLLAIEALGEFKKGERKLLEAEIARLEEYLISAGRELENK